MQKKQPRSNIEFIPVFKASFFYPKYWGVWLGVGAMLLLAYVPAKIRNPFLGLLGKWVGKYAGDARRRARINLYYCFPEMEEREREELIDEMFATASQSMMLMVEQAVRSPEFLLKRTRWHGEEIIEAMRAEGRNVIFMVPHGWSVDVPAMLLAAKGQKMAAMFHNQKMSWLTGCGTQPAAALVAGCMPETTALSRLSARFVRAIGAITYLIRIMVPNTASLWTFWHLQGNNARSRAADEGLPRGDCSAVSRLSRQRGHFGRLHPSSYGRHSRSGQ